MPLEGVYVFFLIQFLPKKKNGLILWPWSTLNPGSVPISQAFFLFSQIDPDPPLVK